MQFRSLIISVTLAALPMLGSCTTRYQDLLRDRDAQIRELNGRIAALRAEKEELERREGLARKEADDLRKQGSASAVPSDAGATTKLQQELEGTTVGYVRGRLSIGIEDSVTFDSGSTALKDTSHKILQKVATALKRDYSARRYYIEGHTDSDPISKTKDKFRNNRHLSVERADAVARYLIEQGIPESRIVVVGYGQYDPKVGSTKAKNRRVEIVVGEQL
jgi:flagellar motor protein MotB